MFDFLKFYFCYEAGYAVGKKLPGVIRAMGKGFALICSFVLWVSIFDGSIIFSFSQNMWIRVTAILYCILVWGGIAGLMVLKVTKGTNLFKIYHWVLLALSLLVGVLAMEETSVGYILLGMLYGFFFIQCPEFIYKLVDAVINKILTMKGNK